MKQFTNTVCLFFFNFCLHAQSFEWGGTFGGSGEDVVRDMHTDAEGNTYTTGYFTDTSDFDISTSEELLTSIGFYDVFVLKTNSEGQYVWAVGMGSMYFDYAVGITSDADGNVYVTGYFDETVDFDPGAGVFNLTSMGGGDIFILKLDADGAFVWAKSVGGTGYEESTAIAVSPNGTVHVLGYFYEPADFNPGDEEYILTSAGGSDTFVLSLNEDGQFISAVRYGGPDLDLALDMKVSNSNDIYIGGYFRGTADFDPNDQIEFNITSSITGSSGYMLHLNSIGELVSASATSGGNAEVRGIAIDANDNVYLNGQFNDTVNFNPDDTNGMYEFTSTMAYNGFIMKYNPFGSLEWASHLQSDSSVFGFDIAVDGMGTVFSTGYFSETADFNPDLNTSFNLTRQSSNASDAYLSALDTDGNFLSAFSFGGSDFLDTHKIGTDALGYVYLSGHFSSTVDINPLADEEVNFTAIDFRDNYIIKMAASTLSIPSSESLTLKIYPNPTAAILHIQSTQILLGKSYYVFDLQGRRILNGRIDVSQQINLDHLAQGTYYLNVAGFKALKVIKN